ncbi:MAG: hypothetical protein RQ741_07295 [Wenzhouxiangellaceae bacterium]|nr:hypothetical protein [Wenzhouxiangellaceae bacterium]
MLKITQIVLLLFVFFVAGSTVAQTVKVIKDAPYAADADIQKKVRNECVKLGSQLSEFTQQFGKEFGVDVALVDSLDTAGSGRVLQLEITDATSMGNAFMGHQKFSSARGTLYEDGKKVADFRARRNSMGGAFAGFKGSCSVLGRTVKAMGKDIALWLKDPEDKAELGNF